MDGLSEEVEVVYRDPLELIRELYGNPTYAAAMAFAPEQHWSGDCREERIYNEMWTGKWWWRRQVRFIESPSIFRD